MPHDQDPGLVICPNPHGHRTNHEGTKDTKQVLCALCVFVVLLCSYFPEFSNTEISE
jgi:hypothetical protein